MDNKDDILSVDAIHLQARPNKDVSLGWLLETASRGRLLLETAPLGATALIPMELSDDFGCMMLLSLWCSSCWASVRFKGGKLSDACG